MRILIIEDNEDVADIVSTQLAAAGYEITKINNGQEGIKMIKTDCFEITMLDLAMPEFSGLDVIDSLEKTGDINRTKIMIMTASEISDVELTKLTNRGVIGWIRKPIDFQTLLATLKNL